MAWIKKPSSIAFWIMPLTVALVAFGFAHIISRVANCYGWWDWCWSRWDSGYYLEISRIGHTLRHCGIDDHYPTGSLEWCGNAGWAPLYSLLIYLLSLVTGWENEVSGIVISRACFLAFLYVNALILNVRSFAVSNWLTLFLCAICPGGIYFFSIFPISITILGISIIFFGIQTKKYFPAGIAAYGVAVSYSSSIVFLFCLGLYIALLFIVNHPWLLGKTKRPILNETKPPPLAKDVFLKVFVPGVLGLLSLYGYDLWVTGHWNAMYLIQGKYGHGLSNPLRHLAHYWQIVTSNLPSKVSWTELQNIVFFFLVLVLTYKVIKGRYGLFLLGGIYLLCMWYIPFSLGTNVSLWRSIGLLAPAFVYLHPLRPLQKLGLLIVFGVFYYFMGLLFIKSVIH